MAERSQQPSREPWRGGRGKQTQLESTKNTFHTNITNYEDAWDFGMHVT